MDRQIREADFVLVVPSEAYYNKYNGDYADDGGLGAKWESMLAVQRAYDSGSKIQTIVPVLFDKHDSKFRINPIKQYGYYCVYDDYKMLHFNEAGYIQLYRKITGQPEYRRPALGEPLSLPPQTVICDANSTESIGDADSNEESIDDAATDGDGDGDDDGGVVTAVEVIEVIITVSKPLESMTASEKQKLKNRIAKFIDASPDSFRLEHRPTDGHSHRGVE